VRQLFPAAVDPVDLADGALRLCSVCEQDGFLFLRWRAG
jgi:hypothetical protein